MRDLALDERDKHIEGVALCVQYGIGTKEISTGIEMSELRDYNYLKHQCVC